MKAKRLAESWEKQTIYRLENGCKLTVEWSQHYGETVSRCDDKTGYWHCSNGLASIPERFAFLRDWIRPLGTNPAIGSAVRPLFAS